MPLLAHRNLGKIVEAMFEPRHYKALVKMGLLSDSFPEVLMRYLTGKGTYPRRFPVKTPLGTIEPTLFSYYDLLTLNEVFFREDYQAGINDRVIVDIGSNIGLSALYFLTRNEQAICHLYEPDPRNVARLTDNMAKYASRCIVNSAAVADQSGTLRFGLDVDSGRYGGLDVDYGHTTTVTCVHINDVLKKVFEKNKRIDILKIDTEGAETRTVKAIDPNYARRIGKIYLEAAPEEALHPDIFRREQYGTVCRLFNRTEEINFL